MGGDGYKGTTPSAAWWYRGGDEVQESHDGVAGDVCKGRIIGRTIGELDAVKAGVASYKLCADVSDVQLDILWGSSVVISCSGLFLICKSSVRLGILTWRASLSSAWDAMLAHVGCTDAVAVCPVGLGLGASNTTPAANSARIWAQIRLSASAA